MQSEAQAAMNGCGAVAYSSKMMSVDNVIRRLEENLEELRRREEKYQGMCQRDGDAECHKDEEIKIIGEIGEMKATILQDTNYDVGMINWKTQSEVPRE